MRNFKAIFKRELRGYATAPLSYVFIVIFLEATVGATFFLSRFFDQGEASLAAFFFWHPWLFLFLVPAIGMRLWAEERKEGTIELLLTLPVTVTEAVLAKFAAAWVFLGFALALTFPMVITVAYLGDPDPGPIITGYLGSILLGGAYLAITNFTSALTRSQVISFILGVVICFLMLLLGVGIFSDFLRQFFPETLVQGIASLGFLAHYADLQRGLIDSRDVVYFLSLAALPLGATITVLETRRSR